MLQSRGSNGTLHVSSVDIASYALPSFARRLMELLDGHPAFQDAFFGHELRGTKSASHHNPGDELDRHMAMDEFLDCLDTRALNAHEWMIDVGLEIWHPGHVVQWLTSAHLNVLRVALPSATDEQLMAILSSKSQFKLDLSAQLQDLGGCRVTPGSRGKEDQVTYINVYTTDKSATYQLHRGVFRRRDASELLLSRIDKLIEDMASMGQIFLECGGSPEADGLEGCARLEVRVPLLKANQVLLDLTDQFVESATISFPRDIWW